MCSTDNKDIDCSGEQNFDITKCYEVGEKLGELSRTLNVDDKTKYEDNPLIEIGLYLSLYLGNCTVDPNTRCSSAGFRSYLKHVLIEHEPLFNKDNTQN